MEGGGLFLIDDISLADDSLASWHDWIVFSNPIKVIKMINNTLDVIQAKDNLRWIDTINPGGDLGKKEVNERTNQRDSSTSDAFVRSFVRSPFSGVEKPFLPRRSAAHQVKPSTTSERFFNTIFNCPIKTLENNVHNGCVSSLNIFEQWSHWNMLKSPFEIYSVGSSSSIWTLKTLALFLRTRCLSRLHRQNGQCFVHEILDLLDQDKGEEKLIEHPTTNDSSRCRSIADWFLFDYACSSNAVDQCGVQLPSSNDSLEYPMIVLRARQLNNKLILILKKSWRRQSQSRHDFGSVSWLSFHSNQSIWTDGHEGEGVDRIFRRSPSPPPEVERDNLNSTMDRC